MINNACIGLHMGIVHPVPWFPAWGIVFSKPIEDLDEIIELFNKHRYNQRWLLLRSEAAASEVHLWTTWHSLRRKENSNKMAARTPDVEFLRLISGTHQIKTGFQRSGLRAGEEMAWILYLPKYGDTDVFGKIDLDRESYLENDEDARILIELIGSRMMPIRPIPTIKGLENIGITGIDVGITLSEIENIFLTQMALSDL